MSRLILLLLMSFWTTTALASRVAQLQILAREIEARLGGITDRQLPPTEATRIEGQLREILDTVQSAGRRAPPRDEEPAPRPPREEPRPPREEPPLPRPPSRSPLCQGVYRGSYNNGTAVEFRLVPAGERDLRIQVIFEGRAYQGAGSCVPSGAGASFEMHFRNSSRHTGTIRADGFMNGVLDDGFTFQAWRQ